MKNDELRENIIESLKKVAPEADINNLDPEENIREALDIDSFDFLNFLIDIGEKTGIDVPESDYDQLDTLDKIVKYIADRKKK